MGDLRQKSILQSQELRMMRRIAENHFEQVSHGFDELQLRVWMALGALGLVPAGLPIHHQQ